MKGSICTVLVLLLISNFGAVHAESLQTANTQNLTSTCFVNPLAAYTSIVGSTAADTATNSTNHTAQTKKTVQDIGLININTASVVELTQLPRIGVTRAQAIVDYRSMHGDFTDINQLTNIQGIGSKTVANFSQHITIR